LGSEVVKLKQLPSGSFDFICREVRERILAHVEMLSDFYERFDWSRNPKQRRVYSILSDPGLPERVSYRVQHVALRGSVGSGKSTVSIAWPVMQMHRFPGAKWLGMRRTNSQLMASLYQQILEFNDEFRIPYSKRLGSGTGPPEIRYPNGSKWVFWSSESAVESSTADNARGLGSTQYSGATLEEADMIHKAAIDTVTQRLREKSGIKLRVVFYNLNPTPENHWLARMFLRKEGVPYPEDYHDFHFTMEDNAAWLPPGYIETQYARYANTPGLFRRFILGEWGPEVKGTPVYGPYFNRDFHVAKQSFIARWARDQLWQDGPVCLCWDFGFRHPAVVVFQDVEVGGFRQIRLLAGYLGDSESLRVFGNRVLDEVYRILPGAEFLCYVDPAGKVSDPRGVSTENALDVLRSMGLNPVATPTSETAGVELVISLLQGHSVDRVMGVQPDLVLEPDGKYTQDLQDMFEVGFCVPEDLGRDRFRPVDDGYYIHLADALRYGLVHRRRLQDSLVSSVRPERSGWRRHDEFGSGVYGAGLVPDVGDGFDQMAYYGFGDSAY